MIFVHIGAPLHLGGGAGGAAAAAAAVALAALPLLLSLLLGQHSYYYAYTPETGWTAVPAVPAAAGPAPAVARWLAPLLRYAAAGAVAGFCAALLLAARRHGWRATLDGAQRALFARRRRRGGAAPAAAPPRAARAEREAAAAAAVRALPVETFASAEQLAAAPAAELRARAAAAGLDLGPPGAPLDRAELIAALAGAPGGARAAGGGSSALECPVCCESYVPGDVLRVLPRCRHRFHVECIDRWLLGAARDYSRRELACPMCNAGIG